MLAGYRTVLKWRGVPRVLLSQLIAHFPSGMISIVLLILVSDRTGSYAQAGLVLSALTIGRTINGPLSARALSVLAVRPTLIVMSALSAGALLLVALTDLNVVLTISMGFIYGLFLPPVKQRARSMYSRLVEKDQRPALYSLDVVGQEIIFLGGPLLAAGLANYQPTYAAGLCAVLLVLGSVWFAVVPEQALLKQEAATRRTGAVLMNPAVMQGSLIGMALVGCCFAYEAAAVASFEGQGALAGAAIAAFALGSFIAILLVGQKRGGPWRLTGAMAIVGAGTAAASASDGFIWIAAWLFVAGFGFAPALSAIFSIIGDFVPEHEAAEAYGWASSAQLVGASIGAALAGALIDSQGPSSAFLLAGGLGILGAVVACAFGLLRPPAPEEAN